MNLFDMKTVIFSYAISNALCAAVITLLWLQNHRRFAGLGFWLADFVMQFAAITLIILRGVVPDFVSMVVSNTLLILGTILLYMGLERFTGKRGPQIHNYALLAIFILVHMYFVVMQPSLAARNINISLGLLVICFQCVWLMLYRTDVDMRPITRGVGLVLAAFCLISVSRIMVDVAVPPENDFFHSNTFETLVILTYQMLFIALTFSLSLMVNRRLFVEMTRDITGRQRAEDALKQSEEKFSKAFHASPDAILISSISDGRLIEVNEGFSRLSEYSREEALTSSTIALAIWANPQDRESCISALREKHSVRNTEYDFRAKSGKILNCLYSGEIIRLGDETHILSVVRDITNRKQAETQVAQLASFPQLNPNPIIEVDLTGAVIFCNPAALVVLKRLERPADARAFLPPDIDAILRALARGEHPWLEREVELNHTVWNEYIHLTPEFQTARIYANNITARKQAEKRINQLFERLNLATRAARLGIWDWDIQENKLMWDDQMYKLYGVKREDFSGAYETWLAGVHPDDRAASDEVSRQARLGERDYDTEFRIVWPDGAIRVLKAYGQVVWDAAGIPLRMTGINYDITKQKQAEEIIRLRLRLLEFAVNHSLEELMQKALDEIGLITNSPIGFYHFVEEDQKTLSLQAWSTRTQQEFCKAEGKGMHYNIDQAGVWVDCVYQRKPVIHNNYAALPHRKGLPPGHAEVVRELVVPTMREGRVVSILGVGNKPSDYDERDVEFVAYIADVIWEIVERKRTEAQLQEYQGWLEAQNMELRKLTLAIEQSGSTIVITDTDGTIQYANPRFEETSGYTVREVLGHNQRLLKSGEQSADYYRVLWETITGGQIWYGEFHNRRKDGSLYWEQVTIAPVHNADGQITNYVAVKDDITAHKQAEETLHERTVELEQRNKELQTALNTIKTLSGMVPICAWCGRKIQDDNGEWVKVETYIQGHTDAEFTHGICPDCKQKSLDEVANLRQTRGQ